MRQAPSRRKATARPTPDRIIVHGEYAIDLTGLHYHAGAMPHTVAECVAAAVRMWCGKYHNSKYGPNRDAEVVSIVWELMLDAPAHATPSSIAHWSCMALINNRHIGQRNGQGTSPHRIGLEEPMKPSHCSDYPADYGNPADVARCHADFDAFVATLDMREEQLLYVLLEHFANGGGTLKTPRPDGWNWKRKEDALKGLQRKYQALHWASPATADWVRRMLAA